MHSEGLIATGANATVATDRPRTGARSFKVLPTSATTYFQRTFPGATPWVSGTDYFIRAYINVDALPTNANPILLMGTITSAWVELRLLQNGALQLATASGISVSTAAGAIAVDTHYRIELKLRYVTGGATDIYEVKIDGTTVLSATNQEFNATLPTAVFFGQDTGTAAGAGSGPVWYDDIAINDSNGADSNSWPGSGKVYYLRPTSVSIATPASWKKPGGSTANRHTSLDNVPLVYEAISDVAGNAEDYLVNLTNTANLDLFPITATYDSVVPAGGTIVCVQVIVMTGQANATDTQGQITVANPTIATFNFNGGGGNSFENGIASATPTTWPRQASAIQHLPTVTRSNGVDITIRRVTASIRVSAVNGVAVIVDHQPASGTTYEETGAMVAGVVSAGNDVREAAELGTIVSSSVSAGADASERTETGVVVATAQTIGSRIREVAGRTGALLASTRLFGVGIAERVRAGSLIASGRLSATDIAERSETGALIARALPAGTDISERTEAGTIIALARLSGVDFPEYDSPGSLIADTNLSGADVAERVEAGALLAAALLAGVGVKVTAGKAGAIMAGALSAGTDATERSETGALIGDSNLTGMDAREAIETGLLRASGLLTGADAAERSETALLAARALLAGADAATMSELGSVVAKTLLSGVSFKEAAGKTGTISAGSRLSGPKVSQFSETGSLIAKTFGAGAKAAIVTKSGIILAGTQLYGADVHIASRTGALVAATNISAFDQREQARAGTIMAGTLLRGVWELLTGYFMDGSELHLLTSATVEDGRIVSAGPEKAVLVSVSPEAALLLSARTDETKLTSARPEKGKLTKVDI